MRCVRAKLTASLLPAHGPSLDSSTAYAHVETTGILICRPPFSSLHSDPLGPHSSLWDAPARQTTHTQLSSSVQQKNRAEQSRTEQGPSTDHPSPLSQSRSPITGGWPAMMSNSSSTSLSLFLLLPTLPSAWAANRPTESMVFPGPHPEVYRSLFLAISLIGPSRPVILPCPPPSHTALPFSGRNQ